MGTMRSARWTGARGAVDDRVRPFGGLGQERGKTGGLRRGGRREAHRAVRATGRRVLRRVGVGGGMGSGAAVVPGPARTGRTERLQGEGSGRDAPRGRKGHRRETGFRAVGHSGHGGERHQGVLAGACAAASGAQGLLGVAVREGVGAAWRIRRGSALRDVSAPGLRGGAGRRPTPTGACMGEDPGAGAGEGCERLGRAGWIANTGSAWTTWRARGRTRTTSMRCSRLRPCCVAWSKIGRWCPTPGSMASRRVPCCWRARFVRASVAGRGERNRGLGRKRAAPARSAAAGKCSTVRARGGTSTSSRRRATPPGVPTSPIRRSGGGSSARISPAGWPRPHRGSDPPHGQHL